MTRIGEGADASEIHLGEIGGNSVVKEVTLTLAASTYADADVLADTQEIADALRVDAGTGVILSLIVLDKDDQAQALDVVFLRTDVSIGTEDDTVSVSDANADEILGIVEVAASDYVDLDGSQLAQPSFDAFVVDAAAATTSLFVAAISRGTGTYTASGITLKVGILRD